MILSEIISSIRPCTNYFHTKFTLTWRILGTIWFVFICRTWYEVSVLWFESSWIEHLIYFSLLKALYMDGQNFLLPQNLLMIWRNNFPLHTTVRAIVNIRPVSGLHFKFLYLICCEHYDNENENDTNQVRYNIFQCRMTGS